VQFAKPARNIDAKVSSGQSVERKLFPLLAMLFFMVSPTIALRRSSKAIYMRS
jgi:hypothetical protein